MAGLYPNVPGHRFAYDLDGTAVVYRNSDGALTYPTSIQVQRLNNESPDGDDYIKFSSSGSLSFAFPEQRNVTGLFYATDEAGTLGAGASWSPDSTDGLGGTWNTVTPTVVGYNAVVPEYRKNINVVNLTGVRAVRINFPAFVSSNYDFAIRGVHIYGDYASATGDRLEFWHPTLDQKIDVAHFDLGDVKRGVTILKQFRIKNLSTTLTANSIAISAGALTVGSPSHVTMHTFSPDNNTYSSSINIGNLAPGAISGVLYDMFVSPMTTPTGPWSGRLSAVAGSWT